jgi:hypothetical protein
VAASFSLELAAVTAQVAQQIAALRLALAVGGDRD